MYSRNNDCDPKISSSTGRILSDIVNVNGVEPVTFLALTVTLYVKSLKAPAIVNVDPSNMK